MKIAVLGNQPNSSFADLCRAAGDRHQLEFVAWSQLMARIGTVESIGHPGDGYDAVVVRGMPVGSLEQVIFQMNALARWQTTAKVPFINSPRSLEISIDKYLSLALIGASGFPIPETIVCQSIDDAMRGFEMLDGDVVIKPVFGGQGRGLIRVSDSELALRSARAIIALEGVVYLQRFIPHAGFDLRLLVIGQRVIAMRRTNRDDWRNNASRGAECECWNPDKIEIEMAIGAAQATQADVAGVDLIYDQDGRPWILEVNGVPGWQHIARTTGVDVAAAMLDRLEFVVTGNFSRETV